MNIFDDENNIHVLILSSVASQTPGTPFMQAIAHKDMRNLITHPFRWSSVKGIDE